MSAPTLANMATAPAVPPRTALAAALSMTSLKDGGASAGGAAAEEDMLYFYLVLNLK
jgi:hypothetical protein